MRPQKFVVRLLTVADELLAWAEVHASPAPQARPAASCPFFARGTVKCLIEQDGEVAKYSVHWCDLDVARVKDLEPVVPVRAGTWIDFAFFEPIWLVPGMRDVPLPAVTVRGDQVITPQTGALGTVGGTM